MRSDLRHAFNAAFTPELYRDVVRDVEKRLGCTFEFRVAETPVFLPDDLRARIERAAREVVAQLSEPRRIAAMESDLPARYATPRRDRLPGVAIVDFAIVRDENGELAPKVVELQGFPSLFGLTVVEADAWAARLASMPGMPNSWSAYFSGLDRDAFLDLFRRSVVGRHRPEEVVLLDLDPPRQKTAPDFDATRLLLGVEAICPTTLVRESRRLLRRREGKLVPVRRVYHRVVFDELEKSGAKLPYRYDEDLDVEWFPHPAWYFLWSKSSLPHLDHPSVPRTVRLSEMREAPDRLERYVLKPFHSFAGGGVNVEPTRRDLDAIPADRRSAWCLQEKVEYAPALVAADGGGVKVEVRTMFLRPDDEKELVLATNLCRLSRGKMHGVDFNKDFTWVGGSLAMWPR
ncbi:MAG TPA: hypothetical protein VKE69_06765 [Planctomycetota bacterium]|nr:hypothetical protein [Planctomycetota bacterium]